MPKFMNVHSVYVCYIWRLNFGMNIHLRTENQPAGDSAQVQSGINNWIRCARSTPRTAGARVPAPACVTRSCSRPRSRLPVVRVAFCPCGVRISTSSRAALLVPPRHPLPPRHARPLTRCRDHLVSDHGTPGSLPRMWLGGWVAGSSSSRRPRRG